MKTSTLCPLAFTCLILTFAMPLPGKAAEDPAATLKAELVQLEKQSWEAWKNHDGKFFAGFLSDDHVELGFGGPTTKASVVSGVSSGACEVKSYTLDHFDLQMLADNTALLTYREAQETSCGGKAVPSPCWVSSLYMRRDGHWLNVLYQQTPAAN